MNNLNVLINKEVINKNGDSGKVVSIDKYYTTVEYKSGETRKLSTELAFIDNGYLKFIDDDDNKIIKDFFKDANDAIDLENELNAKKRKEEREKEEKIKKELYALYLKEKFLASLFGSDFKYPTYGKFKNDNKNIKAKPEEKNSHIKFVPEFYTTKAIKSNKKGKTSFGGKKKKA